jgi:hypothetical protein
MLLLCCAEAIKEDNNHNTIAANSAMILNRLFLVCVIFMLLKSTLFTYLYFR